MRKLGLSVLCVLAGLMLNACAGGGASLRQYGAARGGPVQTADAATPAQRVVIPGFEQFFAEQLKDQWCWAACAQMIIAQQLGKRVDQEQLVRNAFGSAVNSPATAALIQKALALTVGSGSNFKTMRAAYLDGLPGEAELWADLQAGRPRVLAVSATGIKGREHVVVCYGAEKGGDSPSIRRLYIFDPAPGRGAWVVGYDALKSVGQGSGWGSGESVGASQSRTGKSLPRVTGSFRIVVVGT